ncbi:acyl carrier protein [Kitasatospora sp. NPDC127111]|uniref:acyl carrier protein n=1 Tax=Kitasatospora sp. NPDC127111 TaxID=3345363 RepID=UPI00362B72F9
MREPDGLEAFLRLVREELDLAVGSGDADRDLADLPGWDSMNLLRLVTLLEAETGRRLPVHAVLEARSLAEIHSVLERQA